MKEDWDEICRTTNEMPHIGLLPANDIPAGPRQYSYGLERIGSLGVADWLGIKKIRNVDWLEFKKRKEALLEA